MQEHKVELFQDKDRDFWRYGPGALFYQKRQFKKNVFEELFVMVPKKPVMHKTGILFPNSTRDCFLLRLPIGKHPKAFWRFDFDTLTLLPLEVGGKCSIGETPFTIHCEITDGLLREIP